MKINQDGFEAMAVAVMLGAVVIISLIGLTLNNRANSKNFQKGAETSAQPEVTANINAKVDEPSALAKTESVKPTSEEAPPASSAPKPVVPAATPKPVSTTPASTSTPFTGANCTGDTTAYVSNKVGAPVSYQYPDNWATVKVYAYGEKISVYCNLTDGTNYPDYALVNDAYIKKSDLSPTKP